MESSAHNYLHKKFKKQLSVEPSKSLKNEKEITGRIVVLEKYEKEEEEKKISNEECNKIIINNYSSNINNDNHIMRKDNKEIVPNESTNNNQNINNNFVVNTTTTTSNYLTTETTTTTTSSISVRKNVENLQSMKPYISCVVVTSSSNNNQNNFEQLKLNSFDKNFNSNNNNNNKLITEPTSTTINKSITENLVTIVNCTTSSILDNLYTKHDDYIKKFDDHISMNIKEKKDHFNEETSLSEIKSDNRQQDDLNLSSSQQQQQQQQQHQKELQQQLLQPPDKSTGGKYVCTYCNLVCSKPSVLQKHIRAHTNERPYPCISCGFSFKTRSNLYKHCRSRTHANRVMGNKVQELNNDMEIEQSMMITEPKSPHNNNNINEQINDEKCDKFINDLKTKPYKPRFHTSKQVFDKMIKENINNQKDELNLINNNSKHTNSDLLSHHINEIISKNNSIVNSNDSYLLKKRQNDQLINDHINNNNNSNSSNEYIRHRCYDRSDIDEPLNLTNKNRKRCMSEVATEPVVQKSLIKELLLKNLYSDMQCPYCKMIFQTVTELELHKLRSCKGFIKPGAKYSRSNSVNVASILTQNKNAFDNMPNTIFPLKSPGPFLGKTRLVESDKNKSFSFDDGLPSTFLVPPPSINNEIRLTSPRYLLSPLTLQSDKEKKPAPIKLFGGEVQIKHHSGEMKCFKIDNNDNSDQNIVEYNGGKLSENRLVQSTLQSGGTVLTNKPNYVNKQRDSTLVGQPKDILRVYDNLLSTNITNLNKTRTFNFDINNTIDLTTTSDIPTNFNNLSDSISSPTYKYTNIMDFSQKPVKLLNPNLKQPNIIIPGVVPNDNNNTKTILNNTIINNDHEQQQQQQQHSIDFINDNNKKNDNENNNIDKDIFFQPKIITVLSKPQSPIICNPMNLLVNGKVVRYVPGIPGPVLAEESIDMGQSKKIHSIDNRENLIDNNKKQNIYLQPTTNVELSPKTLVTDSLEIRTDFQSSKIGIANELKSPTNNLLKRNDMKSPVIRLTSVVSSSSPPTTVMTTITTTTTNINELKTPIFINTSETKKFARPNSLALKPTTASLKQHHGLTPTMFNQILISPDTPRVAKKYVHQFLHGNYFSYLGLKSSTKPVYCTLNKTQPFYVPHFKKLSMYSEWRQQDTKTDKLYVSAYDSRQKQQKYVTAGKPIPAFVIHSSYKFIVSDTLSVKNEKTDEQQKTNTILGGYESNEDYTYIRGRGRGRYVCDQCGIRCKKPSMLKKHIRTHSNDRPYTCSHCNFSFKTKGNLTKHMKSKAHTKNYAASSSSSSSSTQQSGTQSSESDSEDSGMDSSDESTRREEHEAAYGLLSLSQKNSQNILTNTTQSEINNQTTIIQNGVVISTNLNETSETSGNVMDTDEITHISKTSYVKNKILDQPTIFSPSKNLPEIIHADHEVETNDNQNITQFLGKSNINRPLTYPYTTILHNLEKPTENENTTKYIRERDYDTNAESPKSIKQFHVIQKYALSNINKPNNKIQDNNIKKDYHRSSRLVVDEIQSPNQLRIIQPPPILKLNDSVMSNDNQNIIGTDLRKRKYNLNEINYKHKIQRNDEVMDLSMQTEKNLEQVPNGCSEPFDDDDYHKNTNMINKNLNNDVYSIDKQFNLNEDDNKYKNNEYNKNVIKSNGNILLLTTTSTTTISTPTTINQNSNDEQINSNYIIQHDQQSNNQSRINNESPKSFQSINDYDNSAMETLADIATKQVKLEKNTLAKSVASEYLKLATKNEYGTIGDGIMRDPGNFPTANKDVNELIVKPEGSKSCTICSKSFSKPSQLRLHMNIHYLERPFRCDSCSVSFRTKGHLQKHERSASHHNKLSSSPALSSSEPRPFKCTDCNIAFRIHGHLAKHLRSKMHIMKLECLAKIPFGLYAELERSNSLLTEINTADGDQCLESLKTLAKKVFLNDTNKINQLPQHHPTEHLDVDS